MRILAMLTNKAMRFGLDDVLEEICRIRGIYIEIVKGTMNPQKRSLISNDSYTFDAFIFDGYAPSAFSYQLSGRFLNNSRKVLYIIPDDIKSLEEISYDGMNVIFDSFRSIIDTFNNINGQFKDDGFLQINSKDIDLPDFECSKLTVSEFNDLVSEYIEVGYRSRIVESSVATSLGKILGIFSSNADNVLIIRTARKRAPNAKEIGILLNEVDLYCKQRSTLIDNIHFINRFDYPWDLLEALKGKFPAAQVRSTGQYDLNEFVKSHSHIYYKYVKVANNGYANFVITEMASEIGTLKREINKINDLKDQVVNLESVEDNWQSISEIAAHKLGNPIFAMEAQIENIELANKKGIVDISEYIDQFKYSFERAKTILKQFRNLTSAYKIRLLPVDMAQLRRDFEHLCLTREVNFNFENYAENRYVFDYSKILDCLEELISNSVYCNTQPITINLTLREVRNEIIISYSDDGVGILPENKVKIFDFGFSEREGGSGMGMSSVRQVILSHRGSISEVGVFGDGAIFLIKLPVTIS